MKEENPFEELAIAKEWIHAVEFDEEGSRDQEIYPMLYAWTHKLKPRLIVEIGAGQGICSAKIDLTEGTYVGIEPSTFLVERARELYPETNKTFTVGSAYKLPIESGTVEAMFSVGVWFHLGNLDKVHQEVSRILRPGGKILIITSNSDMDHVWESFFTGEKNGKMIKGSMRVSAGIISKNHLYLHSENDVISSLQSNGMSIVSVLKFGIGKRSEDEKIWMAIEAIKD